MSTHLVTSTNHDAPHSYAIRRSITIRRPDSLLCAIPARDVVRRAQAAQLLAACMLPWICSAGCRPGFSCLSRAALGRSRGPERLAGAVPKCKSLMGVPSQACLPCSHPRFVAGVLSYPHTAPGPRPCFPPGALGWPPAPQSRLGMAARASAHRLLLILVFVAYAFLCIFRLATAFGSLVVAVGLFPVRCFLASL